MRSCRTHSRGRNHALRFNRYVQAITGCRGSAKEACPLYSSGEIVTVSKKEQVCFVCHQCGYQSRKWLGRCPDCGGWDTLAEEKRTSRTISSAKADSRVLALKQTSQAPLSRLITGIGELDRVLGGGIGRADQDAGRPSCRQPGTDLSGH
jgi:DnaJ-class molecular chaperone